LEMVAEGKEIFSLAHKCEKSVLYHLADLDRSDVDDLRRALFITKEHKLHPVPTGISESIGDAGGLYIRKVRVPLPDALRLPLAEQGAERPLTIKPPKMPEAEISKTLPAPAGPRVIRAGTYRGS